MALSIGDLDSSDSYLGDYDLIIVTSEKLDSLLRHNVNWISQIRVLVIDEIHLIHDPSRGPTLEVIIARFKALNPHTQLLALSATIQNALDLSLWLDAKLIQSEWRPVTLREGVLYKNHIKFDDGTIAELEGKKTQPLERLVTDSIENNGQVLVFVNTRRSTVSVAHKLQSVIERTLSPTDRKDLAAFTTTMKRKLTETTSVDAELIQLIQSGIAFHNAGLSSSQRRAVEQGFKERLIKVIVATPTLAAGVNIPAQRVIIRDLWRYNPNFGMYPIPILEYKQ